MSPDSSSSPEFMTCSELVHQEDKYIREYASLYGIPANANRSEILERIILLNPGSEACIPIFKHFTARRGADGRVRITGRVSPAPEPLNKASTVVPPGRRLTRQSAKKLAQNDLSQRENLVALQPSQSPDSSTSSGPSDRPPSPPPSPKESFAPRNISIIPDEVNPAVRFPTPLDTYSPEPSSPAPGSEARRTSSRGSPSVKPAKNSAYPPPPRPSDKGKSKAGPSGHEGSLGSSWLEEMWSDAQRGREALKSELAELTREANEVAGELMKVQILRDREAKEMKQFLDDLRKIVGPKLVETIIKNATEAAEARTSDEDDDNEDEGDGSGSKDDDSETDSPGGNSDSSSHNDNDDLDEDPGDQADREDCAHGDENVTNNQSNDHPSEPGSTLGVGRGDVSLVHPEDSEQPAERSSSENKNESVVTSEHTGAVSDHPPTRQDSNNELSNTSQNKNVGEKRRADSDSDSSPSNHKRPRLTDDHSTTSAKALEGQSSSSRKRSHDSDDSDSAWEVEESVKVTSDESSSSSPHKRPRFGINTNGSLSSPTSSRSEGDSSSSPEEDDDQLNDNELQDEELSESVDPTHDLSDGSPPRASLSPPKFHSRLPPFGYMPWPESPTSTSQPTAGPSSRPMGGPPPVSQSNLAQSHVEDAQPSPGPSNENRRRQRTRGLTRARERLRTTVSGDVEAYTYDEGSDYEHRLEHEAQTMAAWRRFDAPRSTYPFQAEFEVIRGAPNLPYLTFADEEAEEMKNITGKGKGKGKEKA